jgi:hypothetical protein
LGIRNTAKAIIRGSAFDDKQLLSVLQKKEYARESFRQSSVS